ncbi:hypothetical protein OHA74_55115 [Streptomyces phaeochromogenes]|nr:hypothetical protein [Streptomyces phaeochromogenes]
MAAAFEWGSVGAGALGGEAACLVVVDVLPTILNDAMWQAPGTLSL